MNELTKIKKLARIAGIKFDQIKPSQWNGCWSAFVGGKCTVDLPNWRTDYHAIIPLIKKQSEETKFSMRKILMLKHCEEYCFIEASPAELCDALIKSHPKN